MKIILTLLICFFAFFNLTFANDGAIHRENWNWKILNENENLENEKAVLKGLVDIIKTDIENFGVERLVNDILASPKGLHVFSDYSFLVIVENDCVLIFHALRDDLRSQNLNFCAIKEMESLQTAMKKAVQGKTVGVNFILHQNGVEDTKQGKIKVKYYFHMFAYIYKMGNYTFVLNMVKKTEIGFPKLKKNQKQIFMKIEQKKDVFYDRIYSTKI